MAKVLVVNRLDEPVHVAVVRHARLAVHVILSRQQVPIPSGEVIGHYDPASGEAVSLENIADGAAVKVVQRAFAEGLRLRVVRGSAKEGKFVEITLLPPEE